MQEGWRMMERKIRNFEVAVFNDTTKKALGKYAKDTKKLTTKNTLVYDFLIGDVYFKPNRRMNVSVVVDGTVNAGRKLASDCNGITTVLNFADALVPGGLVLVGATTQEENLCRCSNLYQSLTTDVANDYYYQKNIQAFGMNGRKVADSVYLDNLIYSRDVLFFKDDVKYDDVKPYYMDVITCPSPSCRIFDPDYEYEIIGRRAEQIVKSAIANGTENLVLGAWGCGAFLQNPKVVSDCFRDALERYPAFNKVVFAIRDCAADYKKTNNYQVFADTFKDF